MTREEAIDCNKNLRMYMRLSDKNQPCKFLEENYIALDMAIKALEQEPCEDEYIKVPKKALKYRTAGMVAYNAEWLKNHFDIERAVICGEQQPCENAISRQVVEDKLLKLCNELEGIFADVRMKEGDDCVCGLCEYDCDHGIDGSAFECPGFETDECFKLADEIRHEWQSTKDLPPVTPQPKTGYWEYVQYDYNPKLGNWHCSECRCVAVECVNKEEKGGIPLYKYCPQCGTKMIELQAESDHTCRTCKHYTSGQRDGSCGSYICKNYSDWESEE